MYNQKAGQYSWWRKEQSLNLRGVGEKSKIFSKKARIIEKIACPSRFGGSKKRRSNKE